MSVGSRIPKESPLINQAYISSDWDDVMVRKTIRNPHTAGLNLQRVIIIAAMFKKESDVEGAQSARHVRSRAEPQQPQWQKQCVIWSWIPLGAAARHSRLVNAALWHLVTGTQTWFFLTASQTNGGSNNSRQQRPFHQSWDQINDEKKSEPKMLSISVKLYF